MMKPFYRLGLVLFAVLWAANVQAQDLSVEKVSVVGNMAQAVIAVTNNNRVKGYMMVNTQCNFMFQGQVVAKQYGVISQIPYRETVKRLLTAPLGNAGGVDSADCAIAYQCNPGEPCEGDKTMTSNSPFGFVGQEIIDNPRFKDRSGSQGGGGQGNGPAAAKPKKTYTPPKTLRNSGLLSLLAGFASPLPTGLDNAYRVISKRSGR